MDNLCIAFDIHGRQDTTVRRNKVWRELHFHGPPGNCRKFLIEFTKMPVRSADRIRMIAFGQFGMQQIFFQGRSAN